MKKLLLFIIMIAFCGQNEAIGQWATNGTHIYNTNTGNVGIGNSSPSTLLHVAKNMTEPAITVQNLGGIGGATYTMMDNVSGANWKFKATNTGGFKIRDHANSLDVFVIEPNSMANAIYINADGNVGIGNDNPDVALKVTYGTQFDPGDFNDDRKGTILISSSEGVQGLGAFGPALTFSGINSGRRRASIATVQTSNDPDQMGLAFFTHPGTATTNDIVYQAMVIQHNGYVGIGNDNPDVALKVTQSAQFDPGDFNDDRKGTILISSSEGVQGLGAFGPALTFSGINSGRRRASIASVQTSGDPDQMGLAFFTHPGTATANDIVYQAMVIKHGGEVGIGTTTPHASAKLEVSSDNQGFLPPRMTASQRTAITSPAAGLLVYQTNAPSGYYYSTGTNWVSIEGAGAGSDPTSTCIDYDGNAYPTFQIGMQVWMAENLRVTHYRNGDAIPNVTDGGTWDALTSGAYCWYDNSQSANAKYGALYNWYAVDDPRGLCPTGWHEPTDSEWTTLTTYLGGDNVANGKMKSVSALWSSPNTDATNSSGFSGLPGGGRIGDEDFYEVGLFGYWWSSTEIGYHAWSRTLSYYLPEVNRDDDLKEVGFSVRCLRDN